MNEEGFQWLKSRGFNSIRVPFYWSRYEPREGVYDNTYLSKLDKLFALCQKYGIYALINFHQWQWSSYFTYYNGPGIGFPAWLISKGGYADSADGLKQFLTEFYLNQGYGAIIRSKFFRIWEVLVRRYKDNPYVWAYEIINEPTIAKRVPLDITVRVAIMDFFEEFTSRIRQIDSKTIIVYHNISNGGERKSIFKNIVWTKSWYDVAYEGYNPTYEYNEIVKRIQNIKNLYNIVCGTPFIVSEMGFKVGTSGGSQWIRDTFKVMRSVGLNNGYESWNWYIYYKGRYGNYQTPRNSDGSDTFIVPVLREYF